MIEAFVGLPGQGKTYLMVRRAAKAMKRGRPVYANFRVKGATRFDYLWELFQVRDGLILLDEASLVLPAQAWKEVPFEVLAYWRQHRHKGVDVLYSAQDYTEVLKALRTVTQFVTQCKRFGSPKSPWFFTWRTTDNKFREKYGGGIALFDPAIADLYDTHGEDVAAQSFIKTGYGQTWK